MGYLLLITSLSIAGVAAWYSIAGLVAIFAASVVPVIIMGSVLEVGKLVTTSWLYRNWKSVPFLLKSYLTSAVVVLMLITSMGIFGFLSKAHLDQTITAGGNTELKISMLERQISNENRKINDAENVISQLDEAVATLIEYDRIRGPQGSIAVRESQQEERDKLSAIINEAVAKIDEHQLELMPLKQAQIQLEAEVGPLKYIAELIYGEEARSHFDETVRWVIILLVFVFDPLAVGLMIAANMTLIQNRKSKMFYDDGNLRVDPKNVFVAEQNIDWDHAPERTQEPMEEQIEVEDLPEDYETFETAEVEDLEPNVIEKTIIKYVDTNKWQGPGPEPSWHKDPKTREKYLRKGLAKKWANLNNKLDKSD